MKAKSYNQSWTYEKKLSITVSTATCSGRKTDFIQSSTVWTIYTKQIVQEIFW